MVDSRAKGARGEYLVRDMLREHTGHQFERVPSSGALDYLKGDLYVPHAKNKFCIEVKNYKDSPLSDKIIILPNDEGEQMCGNIVVPDMGKEKPELGEVLAVGPGRLTEHGTLMTVRTCQVGDIVMVPKIGTLRVDFEGQEYYLAQDREVLAVIKETTDESTNYIFRRG